ncbi:hypothetical protein Hypma_001755 [Hypsizygus marmoreus]|uniref:Uncharacterized protein n=1 Tax=Hypsizygus marmoreus TaxID=39966 RepID=A0A369J5S7_HYPMA|nr:hypothetical protein Hypma_001755 [Hypsizygus marmoreus]
MASFAMIALTWDQIPMMLELQPELVQLFHSLRSPEVLSTLCLQITHKSLCSTTKLPSLEVSHTGFPSIQKIQVPSDDLALYARLLRPPNMQQLIEIVRSSEDFKRDIDFFSRTLLVQGSHSSLMTLDIAIVVDYILPQNPK